MKYLYDLTTIGDRSWTDFTFPETNDSRWLIASHPRIEVRPKSLTDFLNNVTSKKEQYKVPAIEEVIFNEEGKTTIVRWAGGDKTVVRCGEGETFDRYTGFMAAICKKLFGGTTTAKKLMNSLDKKYQAALKAEEAAKEKAKREEEANALKEKAEKRRAKEDALVLEALVEHLLMEAEAKKRVEEILAARDTSKLTVPFDDTAEAEGEENEG